MKTKLWGHFFLLLVCGVFSVGSCHAAVNAYLVFTNTPNSTLPVVHGETTDAYFKTLGAVEVSDASFGISNPTTIGSATGGAGAGKASLGALTITKNVDSSSPLLFTAASTGNHFQTVTLYVRKSGATATTGSGGTYLRYTFKLVYVTSVKWDINSGGDAPTETVTFAYGALQIAYSQQSATGILTPPVTGTWNQVANNNTFTIPGLP